MIQILQVTAGNIEQQKQFRAVLEQHEPLYPSILSWYDEKVLPMLKTGGRVAFLGYEDDRPVATAVAKVNNSRVKLCHLFTDKLRNGIGTSLMYKIFRFATQSGAKEVYFTIPENVWEESSKEFFTNLGFSVPQASSKNYRLGSEELYCYRKLKPWRQTYDTSKFSHLLSGGNLTSKREVDKNNG